MDLPSLAASDEKTHHPENRGSHHFLSDGGNSIGSPTDSFSAITLDASIIRGDCLSSHFGSLSAEASSAADNNNHHQLSSAFYLRTPSLKNSRSIANESRYAAFVANKFRFDKLGFYGREKERTLLREVLDRSCKNDAKVSSRELILIDGESGSGKTALAMTVQQKLVKRRKGKKQHPHGAFVVGKFNMEDQTGGVPYAAISDICSQVCKVLSALKAGTEKDKTLFDKIRSQIIDKLGSTCGEIHFLKELVPGLRDIANIKDDNKIL